MAGAGSGSGAGPGSGAGSGNASTSVTGTIRAGVPVGPRPGASAKAQKRLRLIANDARRNPPRPNHETTAGEASSLLLSKPFGFPDVTAQHKRIDIAGIKEHCAVHVRLGLVEIVEV